MQVEDFKPAMPRAITPAKVEDLVMSGSCYAVEPRQPGQRYQRGRKTSDEAIIRLGHCPPQEPRVPEAR